VRHRDAEQRAALAGRAPRIGRSRACERVVRIDRDEGVELAIEAGDAREKKLRELDARDFFCGERGRELGERCAYSTTRGTR
jgi:hypothetical protein